MLEKNEIIEIIQKDLDKLIQESKSSMKEIQRIAVAQAWKILQLAVATTVQSLENIAIGLSGKDKKILAMDSVSRFYDSIFVVVDVPFVPNLIEPIMHKYIKAFLMALVGASIDAMVTTFRQIGIFKSKSIVSQSVKPKAKNIRKKK
jgi:hypothetical protein